MNRRATSTIRAAIAGALIVLVAWSAWNFDRLADGLWSELGLWFTVALAATYIVNYAGGAVMLATVGARADELTNRDEPLRRRFAAAMQGRIFWWAFWVSFAAMIANTLLPLALLAELPATFALSTFVVGAGLNAIVAIPIRLWIWHIRQDTALLEEAEQLRTQALHRQAYGNPSRSRRPDR